MSQIWVYLIFWGSIPFETGNMSIVRELNRVRSSICLYIYNDKFQSYHGVKPNIPIISQLKAILGMNAQHSPADWAPKNRGCGSVQHEISDCPKREEWLARNG